jgi:hypothetical protein
MIQTLVFGALVGGMTAFVWGALSWMILPWHHSTFLRFRDEDEVTRVLSDNAPRAGVYGLPAPRNTAGLNREEKRAAEAADWERMKTGPIVMAIVQHKGYTSLVKPLIGAFVIYAISSLMMTWLLLQVAGLSYFARAAFVAISAMAGAVICRLTDWNWHGYSTAYTAVTVADTLVGWFLVGLTLAAVVHS